MWNKKAHVRSDAQDRAPFSFGDRIGENHHHAGREVEQQVQLSKERMTIGRHPRNDIVLTHPAVSGEHAVIVTILDDSFLEDLHSTNGTFVNGHRIGKHFLQHQDVIKMAKFQVEFVKPMAYGRWRRRSRCWRKSKY
jgi:pSer/pThr/pTyr-binding forkhead associated (FHA) protein